MPFRLTLADLEAARQSESFGWAILLALPLALGIWLVSEWWGWRR